MKYAVRLNYVSNHEIERIHKGHFFNKGAMRFFNSRIANYGYSSTFYNDSECIDGQFIYFVTSERYDYKSPRLFTVRRLNRVSGEIITVGEFQQYKTSKTAHKYAMNYAIEQTIE